MPHQGIDIRDLIDWFTDSYYVTSRVSSGMPLKMTEFHEISFKNQYRLPVGLYIPVYLVSLYRGIQWESLVTTGFF